MTSSSHFDPSGHAQMVDVSTKVPSVRIATARSRIRMLSTTAEMIRSGTCSKGDILSVARLAAIGATKLTSQLIPLCHAIPIEAVTVEFRGPEPVDATFAELECRVSVKTTAKTGVEMEALTAASVACLTVYDMVKSVDRGMTISAIELIEKSGGKSGSFDRENQISGKT